MSRLRALALMPVVAFVVLLLGAAATPLTASAQGDGFVRVAHLSPDAPAVDVYVDGSKAVTGIAYKTVTNYLPVPAGTHTFTVDPTGTTNAVITASATISAGAFYTVAAVGPVASIKGIILNDDMSAPPAGDAKVRAVHAAVGAPSPVDVLANGKAAFTGLAFESATNYAPVPAGSYTFGVAPASSTAAAFSASATLNAGDIYTAFAIGNGSAQPYGLLLVNDTAGAAMSGGAGTGGGYLATHDAASSPLATILVTGAVAVLLLGLSGLAVVGRRVRSASD